MDRRHSLCVPCWGSVKPQHMWIGSSTVRFGRSRSTFTTYPTSTGVSAQVCVLAGNRRSRSNFTTYPTLEVAELETCPPCRCEASGCGTAES